MLDFKTVISVGAASLVSIQAAPHKSGKTAQITPNIILIYMDDMGYGDIGRTGAADYLTPNLDLLAEEGMQFTWFYCPQAVSSASRAGLLTGCYPNRIGISGALFPWSTTGINSEETTIAELLKTKGYRTGITGKWHLGHQEKFLPLRHGFDEYYGLPYSNDMWPINFDGTPFTEVDMSIFRSRCPVLPLLEGNEKIAEIRTLADQDKLTTDYTQKALNFIETSKDQPFFLYMAHSMPHVPLGVSDKFRGKSGQGLYGDVIMEIDWSVGEIMKSLEKNGLTENTLIIFTSDNGPWLNYGNNAGSAGGLREGKSTSWEGGQRVPCIMRWPGVIPKGSVCNKLASSIDILPTLAAITGADLPAHKIDGVNILPLLQGNKDIVPRHEFYYYYQENDLEAVQQDHWKLVFPHSSQSYENQLPGNDGWPGPLGRKTVENPELYDLRRDPGERYNVIKLYPDKVKELGIVAEKARKDLGDNLTNNPGSNRRKPGSVK